MGLFLGMEGGSRSLGPRKQEGQLRTVDHKGGVGWGGVGWGRAEPPRLHGTKGNP